MVTGVDASGSLTTPETLIGPNSSTVTFTLSALTNDVKADPASTFKITAPAGTPNYVTSLVPAADFPKGTIDGIEYPIFRVPAGLATGITATYEVTFPTIASKATMPGVIINGAGRLVPAGITYQTDFGVQVDGTILPASGAVTGTFNLALNTGSLTQGLSRLSIEVPVCAIDTTTNSPGIWYVRGGMSQTILDAGKNANSLGGAVLLAVGPVNINGLTVWTLPQ